MFVNRQLQCLESRKDSFFSTEIMKELGKFRYLVKHFLLWRKGIFICVCLILRYRALRNRTLLFVFSLKNNHIEMLHIKNLPR